jgi:CheY-like chemotaxis protein
LRAFPAAPQNRLKTGSWFRHVSAVSDLLPLPMTLPDPISRPARPPLAGLEVLLVEHESAAVFVVEDMLFNLGAATVWHAANVDDALALLRDHRPGVAVVDVSLAGEPAYPVAERLQAAAIPFVFVAGYSGDSIKRRWSDQVTVQKPFRPAALAAALSAALDAKRTPPVANAN